MAAKETPKKRYLKSITAEVYSSSCRLCKAVVDKNHCRDLFKPSNRAVLKNVENIFGDNLPRDNSLPHLICRPCERRLTNAIAFKNVIIKTQKSLEAEIHSKRCLEISAYCYTNIVDTHIFLHICCSRDVVCQPWFSHGQVT